MFVYLPFCWALFSYLFVFAQSFVKNQIAYSMRVVLPFFSPLLSFFCNIFSKTYLLRNEIGNAISYFCVTLCCALLKSLLCILNFVDFFNNKTNFDTPFFDKNVAKILCFNYSPSQIFLIKRNLTKKFFLEGSFSRFFYSLPFKKSIFENKKTWLLYFSLYCFCLICSLFRVVSLCLLSLLLLF